MERTKFASESAAFAEVTPKTFASRGLRLCGQNPEPGADHTRGFGAALWGAQAASCQPVVLGSLPRGEYEITIAIAASKMLPAGCRKLQAGSLCSPETEAARRPMRPFLDGGLETAFLALALELNRSLTCPP